MNLSAMNLSSLAPPRIFICNTSLLAPFFPRVEAALENGSSISRISHPRHFFCTEEPFDSP